MKIATISLDDGGMHDLAIIHELDARNIRGTFYLPTCSMTEAFYAGTNKKEFSRIYQNHEVGAHGRLHRSFRKDPCNVREEICVGLLDLRMIFASTQDIRCFAYPYGDTTPESRAIVKEHFEFGRTVLRSDAHDVAHPKDPTIMPITGIFSRGSLGTISVAAQEELPIHILAHPWEIGIKWDLSELVSLIDLLVGEGYSFIDNLSFFQRTIIR